MKLAKSFLYFVTLALGVATAASGYHVTIPTDIWAGDTQLKAGDYQVTMEGNQATFTMGKKAIQIPASFENNTNKFADTMLESSGTKLQAIDIGGTKMKIVFRTEKATTIPAQ